MRVGTLEIQLLANMASLSRDMKRAEQVVGGAMGNVERSVASAKRAMQTLGVGLPIAAITDQVRRMSDQYTKLDAQIRLATKSQAAYAQGMADIRRISTIAQADISATSMLYTRLINTMEGTGVAQSKLATVTETISFGLKAYGATTQEAASAALQLSQAMGANRLGGEEFRAVMEAMPNVMKVLADSMGVPLGQLRQLSIDGKITADEMIKAFGDPAIAAQFKALAESTQTVTGAWQVARNELMLLVGEFTKSSGVTSGAIAGFNAFAAVFRFAADNIGVLTNALLAYSTVMAGKFITGLVQARLAQMALTAAHVEALGMNVVMARAETQRLALNMEVIASERAKAAVELQSAQATMAATAAVGAHSAALRLNAVATAQAAAATANLAALGRAQAASATQQTAATAALAAAEKAQAASSVTIMGRVKGLAGKTGWIGMALFGAWTVYDFLNGMQQVADGADKLKNKFEGMSLAEVQMARQRELVRQIGMRGMFQDNAAIQNSQDMVRAYDQQIAKMVELQNAETRRATVRTAALTGDAAVMQARFDDLAKELGVTLTQAEYEAKVLDLYGQGAKAAKAYAKEQAALAKERKPIDDYLKSLREEIDLYGLSADAIARYKAEKAGGNVIEQERAAADAKHLEYLKDAQKQTEANDALKKRADERAAQRAQDAIDAQTKAHEELWKSIEGAAHDTWTRVWTEGRDAFTNIGKTIKSAILDLLYQMTVKKWIIGVSATGASGAASASNLTSPGGGLGGMSWLTDFGGNAADFATTAGAKLYNAGAESVGSWMIGNAGAIGSAANVAGQAAGYLNAVMAVRDGQWGTAVGSALGTYLGGPIGGAIGSTLGGVVDSIFGWGSKGRPTQSTSDVTQSYMGATRLSQTTGRFGGTGGAGTLDQLAASIAGLTTALGGTAGAQSLFFGSNTGGRGNNYAQQFMIAGSGYASAAQTMTPEAVATESARVMIAALQQSELPKYLKDFFNSLAPAKMSAQDVDSAIQYAQGLKALRDQLTETRTPIEIATAAIADLGAALGTSATTYTQDFIAAIDSGLTPATLAQWQQFGVLIQQATNLEAQKAAQAVALAGQQRQLDIRLMEAQGNAAGALAAKRADEIAALDASLQPTLLAIFAAQDKAAADAEAARMAQVAAQMAQAAADAQAQAAEQARSAAQQITSAWQSVTDAIFEEVARIRGIMGATTTAAAETQFAIATAQARAGDQGAAKMLPGLARAVLDIAATTAGTALELARVRGRTLESLTTTGTSLAGKYGLTIPSFAVGVNEVPQDMVAQIHKGEEIKPAAYVEADRAASANTNTLLSEIRLELAEIRRTNLRMWQTTEQWDIEGTPEVRTV